MTSNPCMSCGRDRSKEPGDCPFPANHNKGVRATVVQLSELGDDWTAEAHVPNIADTCCGKCPGDTCYVDFITGERGT